MIELAREDELEGGLETALQFRAWQGGYALETGGFAWKEIHRANWGMDV